MKMLAAWVILIRTSLYGFVKVKVRILNWKHLSYILNMFFSVMFLIYKFCSFINNIYECKIFKWNSHDGQAISTLLYNKRLIKTKDLQHKPIDWFLLASLLVLCIGSSRWKCAYLSHSSTTISSIYCLETYYCNPVQDF